MEKVKHGVIGLGFFGEKHAEAINDIANFELYAVCTRTESRLDEIAKRLEVPHAYTDYNEMLVDPELESLSVVAARGVDVAVETRSAPPIGAGATGFFH